MSWLMTLLNTPHLQMTVLQELELSATAIAAAVVLIALVGIVLVLKDRL